jgi:hypothetical protein
MKQSKFEVNPMFRLSKLDNTDSTLDQTLQSPASVRLMGLDIDRWSMNSYCMLQQAYKKAEQIDF